ncbi:MAG: hypothetical protein ACLFNZ_09465 [Spirochaetaceae bacterium]
MDSTVGCINVYTEVISKEKQILNDNLDHITTSSLSCVPPATDSGFSIWAEAS